MMPRAIVRRAPVSAEQTRQRLGDGDDGDISMAIIDVAQTLVPGDDQVGALDQPVADGKTLLGTNRAENQPTKIGRWPDFSSGAFERPGKNDR